MTMYGVTLRPWAAAALVLLVAAPVAGQDHAGHAGGHEHHGMTVPTEGLRAELIRDIEQLERKYIALAEAMAGHYDWRPGEGVRSVGEVFGHVAGANFLLPRFAGIDPPESYRGAEGMRAARSLERADEAAIRAALEHSFRHARHAIARTSDAELDAAIQMFGREATKRSALTLVVTHMHEHLGQSIAYARTNGVTPPWSAN